MAKRDINLRGVQLQMEYEEMKVVAAELAKEFKAGNIPQEDYDNAVNEVEIIKNNYLSWVEFIALLNKPKDLKNKNAYIYRSWYDKTPGLAKESILDESKDALADLKKMLKEIKKEENK